MSKTVIAAEQRHRTTQNLFLAWLGPFGHLLRGRVLDGARRLRVRIAAEPLTKFKDEEYKGPWSIQLCYGAPP